LSSREKKIEVSEGEFRNSIEDLSINIDGGRVHFRRAGTGPALILVHGLLGHSFSWRYTIPELSKIMTVYAPDMPGAGFSDFTPGMDCRMAACAERLLRFMDAIAVEQCDLLATSHGGAVAMQAAALAPERVRRMVLAAAVNPWSAHGKILTVFLSSMLVAPAFVHVMPNLRILHEFYFRRMYGESRRIRAGTLEGYMQPLLRPGAFRYAMGVIRSWNQDLEQLSSILPRIADVPTLLIWGSLDGAVDPSSAVKLKQQFRNARLLVLEGVGHLPYEEVPDAFNQAVLGFLENSSRVK
jgi:pimeloyl-ACP methyl ester carboxylesterase